MFSTLRNQQNSCRFTERQSVLVAVLTTGAILHQLASLRDPLLVLAYSRLCPAANRSGAVSCCEDQNERISYDYIRSGVSRI